MANFRKFKNPMGFGDVLSRQTRPNTQSLRGREAGTSSRDKSGKPIGSKAYRAKNRKKP